MVIPPALRETFAQRLLAVGKVTAICVLILLLHVPLFMTQGVLQERQIYRTQAAEEISGLWGRRQTITGPVLAVPYVYRANVTRAKAVGGRVAQVDEIDDIPATAYFLPEVLGATGTIAPEVRSRGIHEVVVYTATLRLTGHFQPDFTAAGIAADRIDWEKAQVLIGLSDLRGVRTVGPVTLNNGTGVPFEAADPALHHGLALAAKTLVTAGTRIDFAFDAALQGSERIDFVPTGRATTVELRSPWRAPSFGGAYLPVRRSIGADGFAATWEISHFSRGFGQSWTSRGSQMQETLGKMTAAGFGVAFTQSVDAYRLVERAQKYGVLFFILVFTVFFLFEVVAGLRIHPLQYTLVGAALCLFFLGFLALSEFWAPGWAYGAAAAACTAMISLYAWSFLRTGRRTLAIGSSLGLTYGGLYFVLKSQDYALIAGTAALFVGLALVMYVTRRLNWNRMELTPTPA